MPPTQKAVNMELWKDIPGYEGIYEASNHGRIRTKANKTTSNSRFRIRHWKQRILKQKYSTRSSGKKDFRVSLWKNGKRHDYLTARLIALTWCDGFSDGMTVNHIDGNPENNNADNLEWVSLERNIRHGFDNGFFRKNMKPVTLMINGEMVSFASMSEASRALGRSHGYVSSAIKKGQITLEAMA